MSKQATMQIRIEESLKQQADQLFETLGLSVSEAVRLFVAQALNERRLPFTPHVNKAMGGTSAFGKLRHYGNPELEGDERSAWLKEQSARSDRGRSRIIMSDNRSITIVDETVLLRYLLDDDPRSSAKARRLIASGCTQAYPEVVARTVRILEEDYRVPRSLIGTVVELLVEDIYLQDSTAIRIAARLYIGNRLPFTACLTASRNMLTGHHVESFNKQLTSILS